VALLVAVILAVSESGGSDPGRVPPNAVPIIVSDGAVGRPIASGYLGLSFEYPAIRRYTGSDPSAINPILVQLIRNLAPGQSPVLRVGGDSTDTTWWPLTSAPQPRWVKYSLSSGWLATTRALASALGARLILGINLAADSRAIAGAEARALVAGLGRQYIGALELGNEPEVYGHFPWYENAAGHPVYARPAWYSVIGLRSYIQDLLSMRGALPAIPLAAPATGGLRQLKDVGELIRADPTLGLVTFHRYPLNRCFRTSDSPLPATVANLLSSRSSRALMNGAAPYVAVTHRAGVAFRVGETNSVACGGQRGVSDTFASALWVVDALFSFARAGVDGVNIHVFPGAHYSLFQFGRSGERWTALVHPEYYGLLLFARAAPPGARLVSVKLGRAVGEHAARTATRATGTTLRAWATRAEGGTVRVVLINDSTTFARTALVRARVSRSHATLERLRAPSVYSTTGVTLAGQTFGTATDTGRLGGDPHTISLGKVDGGYVVSLPAATAALVTITPG
jgi:Glycosyl hydrolase family 79 C-terminal beta domain